MKTKPAALVLVVLSILSLRPDLFGNGGGYLTGGVALNGDLEGFEPKSTEGIRMAKEVLHVRLGPERARVEIRYRMENVTPRRLSVRFGFPVEESPRVEGLGLDEDFSRVDAQVSVSPVFCEGYRILDGSREVKAKWQPEKRAAVDERFARLAGWFVSEVPFAAGEVKQWSLSFGSVYTKSVRTVSDDSHVGAAVFKYRLSTAACWSGTIGKGRIVLEPDGIAPEELRVIKPVNRFRREGRNWVWEFTDFEPTLDDDLEVEAQPAISKYFRGPAEVYSDRGGRWELSHAAYRIRASSTLPPDGDLHHEAENLKSENLAWSEGAQGPGVGEWLELELEPEVPKRLAAISFRPGYGRGDEDDSRLFRANARPRRVAVELNDEHRFSVDIPDQSGDCRIPVEGYDKSVSKIRLTFEEVWTGEHFEDLCLRNLRLHARLDRKPEIQPAR